MLRKVMVKDLLLNRQNLVLNGLIFLALELFWVSQEDLPALLHVLVTALLGSMMLVTIVAREDRFHAVALSCSLPVSRRTVVGGRYLLGLALGGAWILVGLVLAAVLPFSSIPASRALAPGNILFGLTVLAVLVAFLFPFTLRWGFLGLVIGLTAGQVLGILAMVGARFGVARGVVRSVFGAAGGAIRFTRDALGSVAGAAVVLVVAAGVCLVSFWLAVWLFERKDL
jgi:ABC-type transport system involved in multi-copper enzyme maturation permease subunit